MASSFIANAHQVNFESVLAIPDNEGMLNMFKALEASGLQGFLGCQSVLNEKELEQFFDPALVQDGDITGAVSGKFFSISQSRFAEVFDLPMEGLVDFSEVPKNLFYDARSIFSKSGVPVSTYGKKRFMKHEYRLLNDILAKAITVNWSKILFGVLKEMVDKTQKKAKGYAAQICALLKSNPVITFGEAVPFPTSKVLSIKTVHYSIAMNHTIDARGQSDEPGMASGAIVKRKSKSKKTSETTGETPVEVITEVVSKKRPTVDSDEPVVPKKRRTTKSKASSSKASLDIVNVAQDVVPLQIVEPTPAETAEKSPLPKRKSKKRRLVLSKDSDDGNVEEKESVKDTFAVAVEESTVVKHTDEVDVIIGQQKEHGIISDRPSSSQPFKDLADNSGAVLAQFYSLAKSTCWIRPMVLINGVWTPIQGNDYWRSSCRLSLFVNRKQLPESEVDANLVPHCLFIEPVQYWGAAPSIIHSWGWYRVCTEVIRYSMFGCLRPVRYENLCRAIVAISSVVDVLERLPTNFCSVVEQGQATDNFVCYFSDSDVQSELERTLEIDLVSSDGSTVYRSPSPQFDSFQEDDSSEPNVQLASGPTISVFTQDEQSYFVQSPESPPPLFQRRDSSTSFTDSPTHFKIDDIPLDDTADTQFSLPAISSVFSASLDDLRIFLSQRIDDSQNDILSRLNTLDRGHRDTMRQHEETIRNLIHNARQDNRTQGDVLILHLNEFNKGVLAHGASVTADLMEVRKEVKALDAKVTYLDGQVSAIRSELFDFQAKVAENYLNISTQLGDLVDYIRGGDAKKGEGSSSRPQPPLDDQGGGSGGRTTDIVDRFSGSMSREDRGRGRSGERRSSCNRSGHSNRRSTHPYPIASASLYQRHVDTAFVSPNPSISTDSRIFFTTDDTPLGVDQILLPSAITPQDFNEPLAQLRASVNQIQTERVQKMVDAVKLKDELLLHIRSLDQRLTKILDQQDRTYRGLLTHVQQKVQLQKAALSLDILASQQKLQSQQVALSQVYDDKLTKIQDRQDALSHELMEFHVQAQENYNHLTSQLSELVDYINR
ncbi:hypothetical protein F511_34756 [Dorcoceras hygrometricum]|uniref:Dystroglycan-like n=1 Tax=Dorcoceras hygrometricum TaxID=472368 RepID=A0A2Z7CSE9_9LAMI|nr:hypothetical protein F511_34756 [Dorcoceras hygrometricum]